MLGIVEQMSDLGPEPGQGVTDELQIVGKFNMQGIFDMDIPALAENGYGRRLGIKQSLEIAVHFRFIFEMPGRTKGGQFRVLELDTAHLLKKLHGHRVGTRPASFNKIDAKLIKGMGDVDFIVNRQIKVFGLGPIPQGCIIYFDFSPHDLSLTLLLLGKGNSSCRRHFIMITTTYQHKTGPTIISQQQNERVTTGSISLKNQPKNCIRRAQGGWLSGNRHG